MGVDFEIIFYISWIIIALLSTVLIVIFSALYFYFQNQFIYWSKRNVPHSAPSFPFGSLNGIQKDNSANVFRKLYNEGKHHRYFGIWVFHKPSLLINDPDLIKRILISDFSFFQNRGIYYHEKADPLSANLVTLEGEAWKNMRGKLSPAFTSGKIKIMLPKMIKHTDELKDLLVNYSKNGELVEMVDVAARFTTDVICSCAFGIEANALKNPEAVIRRMGQKTFLTSSSASLKNLTIILAPKFAEFFRLSVNSKEVSDCFLDIFREVLHHREKSDEKRNDLLELLIELKNGNGCPMEEDESDKLTFEQIVAQAFIFLIGGFETSGLTIQYALYELSRNQNIQEKARNEIMTTLRNYNGELTHECIYKMEYLGRVIDETLRKYPATPGLIRIATETYQVPDSDLVVQKGTPIIISTLGIHMDERYYPNPEIFDPDRFIKKEIAMRSSCKYLPFGEGPRNCIGQRFALLEVRVGLISLLSNFKFSVPDEYESASLKFNPKSTLLEPSNGMYLKISLLENESLREDAS